MTGKIFGFRRAFLALSGGSVAALAAGCGGKASQVSSGVPGKYSKRTAVVFWHSYGGILGEEVQKLATEFNTVQNEIYVSPQFQGSYEQTVQKTAAAIIAKKIPDIVSLSEVTWRKLHLADALEPMNKYFDDQLQPDMYIDQFIDEGTVKGTTWWLPFARSTPLFYFNRDLFQAAGLPDRGPKTWTELKEWTPALLSAKGKHHVSKLLALDSLYASWVFQGNVWQWGGHYSDGLDIKLDTERPLAAAHWFIDYIRKHNGAYLSQSGSIDFANGVCACSEQSAGSLKNITEQSKFRVGTAFLPEHEHFGCPTGGSGLGILRETAPERKRAAFEFIKFLARPEKSAQWTMASGYLPIVKKAQQIRIW